MAVSAGSSYAEFWGGPGSARGSAGLSHMSEASVGPLSLLLTSYRVGQPGSDGRERERERKYTRFPEA